MPNRILFILWGGLFILCAGLGFIPEPAGVVGAVLTVLSVLFFLPAFAIVYRAGKSRDRHTLKLMASLSALSLGGTLVLLIANVLSAVAPEAVGTALYYLLIIVSSPMVCSGYWVLSLFLWACVLMASLRELKNTKTN